jgi:hypothetical protein
VVGNWNWTRLDRRKTEKSDFDRPVTARSNWGLMFVINKTPMGGGGLAEGRRQKAAREIAKIAMIAKNRRN